MNALMNDQVFGALAQRLGAVSAQTIVKRAIQVASEDVKEFLGMELAAEGAPPQIAEAIRVFPVTSGLVGTVGLPDDDSAVTEAAENWEYGSIDGKQQPHGTFRMMSTTFAEIASQDVADQVAGLLVDQ